MSCLYLEIKGQSCLVGSVGQGLIKIRQIKLFGRMTQKRDRKKISHIFPIASLTGIIQQITPQNVWQTFQPNYRLSIVIALKCNTHISSLKKVMSHIR